LNWRKSLRSKAALRFSARYFASAGWGRSYRMAKFYPYSRGSGPNDKTLDLDPKCEPDFLLDAHEPWPFAPVVANGPAQAWGGVLIDPPYSEEDAARHGRRDVRVQ